jgi:hypothetical protein
LCKDVLLNSSTSFSMVSPEKLVQIQILIAQNKSWAKYSPQERGVLIDTLGEAISKHEMDGRVAVLGSILGERIMRSLNFNHLGAVGSKLLAMEVIEQLFAHYGSLSARGQDQELMFPKLLTAQRQDLQHNAFSRGISSERLNQTKSVLEKHEGLEFSTITRDQRTLLFDVLLDSVPFNSSDREILVKNVFGEYQNFQFFSAGINYNNSNLLFVMTLVEQINAHSLWSRVGNDGQFLFLSLLKIL